MPIEAQAADGTIHQFPDGTQPAIVDKAMKDYAVSLQKGPEETTAGHKLGVAATAPARGFFSTLATGLLGATGTSGLQDYVNKQVGLPTLSEMIADATNRIGPQPNKANAPERYINSVGEAIGAIPAGGPLGPETSVARALTTAGAAGVGGQAGADLTGNSWWGRLIGALFGGGLPMMEKTLLHPNNARQMAQMATQNMPDKAFEFQQAAGNQATAAGQGIPQTTAQSFENAPGVSALQDALIASGKAPKTTRILQTQTGVATGKAQEATSALPGTQQSPIAVANQTQQAATDAVKAAYQQAGEAFRNTLKQAGGSTNLSDKSYAPFVRWLKSMKEANPNSNVGAMADDALEAVSNPAAKAPKQVATTQTGPVSGVLILPKVSPQLQRAVDTYNALRRLGLDYHNLGNEDTAITRLGAGKDQDIPYEQLPQEAQILSGSLFEHLDNDGKFGLKDVKLLANQQATANPAANASRYISDPLAAKQALDDSLSGFGPRRLNSDSVGANESRAMAQIRAQFNAMLEKSSPAVAQANAAYESTIKNVVNPLKEGPVGQVAGRIGAQEGIPAPSKITSILDKGTAPGTQVSSILTLAREMNKQDPTAFASAVKSNLAQKLAENTKTIAGQLDPAGLQAFHDAVYGNAALKQGLKEQLVGVAEGQGMSSNALYPGFLKLIDTIGRQKIRPSSTAGVSPAQLSAQAGSNPLSNVVRIFFPRAQAGAVEKFYAKDAYKQIDHIMSSPEGVQLLQQLSRHDPMGKIGQQAIITYLGGTAPQNSGETSPQN